MKSIPRRQIAALQVCTLTRSAIGEQVETWSDALHLYGVLDMSGGGTNYTKYNAKTMESTHVFVCDFVRVPHYATQTRIVIDGAVYDVAMIDDPCGLHDHLEIYLNYKGAA
jgi:head-tail adaptor